jgi:purine operon repressor
MSLARRALPTGAKVLIIDDFMKAGGTAKGMADLMKEFKAEVLGMGVLVDTKEPENKLVDSYLGLLELVELDEKNEKVVIISKKSHLDV